MAHLYITLHGMLHKAMTEKSVSEYTSSFLQGTWHWILPAYFSAIAPFYVSFDSKKGIKMKMHLFSNPCQRCTCAWCK